MQPRNVAIAVAGLCLAAAAIVWSGAQIAVPRTDFQADQRDISDADALDSAAPSVTDGDAAAEVSPPAEQTPEPEDFRVDNTVPPDDKPASQEASPADVGDQAPVPKPSMEEIERLPPRAPLSELAAPKSSEPPKTVTSDERKSARLFKPVASSAGTIEAQGYKIALAGIEPTEANETCTFDGKQWPCGLQARTAFRSWLRGRAIACDVPSQPDQQILVAECNIGKADLSEWLVANGWAKASSDGPYVEAGRKASEAHKGIFGAPAETGSLNLPQLSDPEPMAFPQTGSILEEQEQDPAPVIVQPPLAGPFPPAPQAPQ